MKPENKAFLDDNRHHHDTLVRAQYLKMLSGEARSNMQRIMGEEFQPGYTADLWCPPCVVDMVLMLYRRYDDWLKEQPAKEPEQIAEPIMAGPPIQVQANFPKHNKNHRR